jgi:hypothetical protein
VTSRILPDGSMESNPLWRQEPPLRSDIAAVVYRFLPETGFARKFTKIPSS